MEDKKALDDLLAQQSALLLLLKSQAWVELVRPTLKSQYGVRVSQIIESQDFTPEGINKREYLRGEAAGIVSSLKIPEILLAILNEDIKLLGQTESLNARSNSYSGDNAAGDNLA